MSDIFADFIPSINVFRHLSYAYSLRQPTCLCQYCFRLNKFNEIAQWIFIYKFHRQKDISDSV